MSAVLAIDAGHTGVTAVLVTPEGEVLGRGRAELPQHVPRPGRVEHVPEEIVRTTLDACRTALQGFDAADVAGVGIADRHGPVVLWDRETLGSPRPAIGWPDRRTTGLCAILAPHEDRIAQLTGLRLDPRLLGPKLAWIRENEPHTWANVVSGRYAVGTVDSYLVARMTRGTWHVSDVSRAARTLLLDVGALDWSEELCSLFGVPRDALPELVRDWGTGIVTDARSFLGLSLPVAGIAADQQAALFGEG